MFILIFFYGLITPSVPQYKMLKKLAKTSYNMERREQIIQRQLQHNNQSVIAGYPIDNHGKSLFKLCPFHKKCFSCSVCPDPIHPSVIKNGCRFVHIFQENTTTMKDMLSRCKLLHSQLSSTPSDCKYRDVVHTMVSIQYMYARTICTT